MKFPAAAVDNSRFVDNRGSGARKKHQIFYLEIGKKFEIMTGQTYESICFENSCDR